MASYSAFRLSKLALLGTMVLGGLELDGRGKLEGSGTGSSNGTCTTLLPGLGGPVYTHDEGRMRRESGDVRCMFACMHGGRAVLHAL